MNRVMLAAIAVVLVVFGAAIVMCYDVVDDNNKDDGATTPTDSNDQVFEWPDVNDPEMGSIGEPFAEGSWNKVWFRAEANIGYKTVDAEENAALAEKYGVMQAPTLVVVGADGVSKYANASNISRYAESIKK